MSPTSESRSHPSASPAVRNRTLKEAIALLCKRDQLFRTFTEKRGRKEASVQVHLCKGIKDESGKYVLSSYHLENGVLNINLDESVLAASKGEDSGPAAAIAASEIYSAFLGHHLTTLPCHGMDSEATKSFVLLKQLEFLRLSGNFDDVVTFLEGRKGPQPGIMAEPVLHLLRQYQNDRRTHGDNELELVRTELSCVNGYLTEYYRDRNFRPIPNRQEPDMVELLLHLGTSYRACGDHRNALRQFSHALMFRPHDQTLRTLVVETVNDHVERTRESTPDLFTDFQRTWNNRDTTINQMWEHIKGITLIDELANIPESRRADGTIASRLNQVDEAVSFLDHLDFIEATGRRIDTEGFEAFLQRHCPEGAEPLDPAAIREFASTYALLTSYDRRNEFDEGDITRKILWLSAILLPYARVLHGDESLDAWHILPRLLFRLVPADYYYPVVTQVMALTTLHRNFGTMIFGEGSPTYTELALPEVTTRVEEERRKILGDANREKQTTAAYPSRLVVNPDPKLARSFMKALDSPDVAAELEKWVNDALRNGERSDLCRLFPNIAELVSLKKYGVTVLAHTMGLIRAASFFERGDKTAEEAFSARKKGDDLPSDHFATYHAAMPGLDAKARRRMFYLTLFCHDLGEAVAIKSVDGEQYDPRARHEERGAIMFPRFVRALESAAGVEEHQRLSDAELMLGTWLIRNHVELGTIHFTERTIDRIFPVGEESDGRRALKPPVPMEEAVPLLALTNVCDVMSINDGKPLSRDKSNFFVAMVRDPASLESQYRDDLFRTRCARYSSNSQGALSLACRSEMNRALEEISDKFPDQYKVLVDNFGKPEVLPMMDYAIFFLQSLKAKEIVKLLFIISQVLDADRVYAEKEKRNPAVSWVGFTAKSAEAPHAAIPMGEVFSQLSLREIASWSQPKPNRKRSTADQICGEMRKRGITFEIKEGGKLEIDNKKLSDFSRYTRLASIGAAGWVVAKGTPVLTNDHIRNYGFLHDVAEFSRYSRLKEEWPKIRLFLGIFGEGRDPIRLRDSAERFKGRTLLQAAQDMKLTDVAAEFEAMGDDLDGFEEFMREVNIKDGIWNLRNIAALPHGKAAVIRLLYGLYLAQERYEQFSSVEEQNIRIRVLKFSHALTRSNPGEGATLNTLAANLGQVTCEQMRAHLKDAASPGLALKRLIGLAGRGIEVEPGNPPDTLLVTLDTSKRVRRSGQRFTLDIHQDWERASDTSLTGGKGASLARLQRIPGIEVPEGFIVTTEAYDEFLEQGPPELRESIAELDRLSIEWIGIRLQAGAGKISEGQADRKTRKCKEQIKTVAERVRTLIGETPIPREVEEEVRDSYNELEEMMNQRAIPVAVRSSGVAEDTDEASFAGQQKTKLNQAGIRSVLGSLKECWISTFGDNAVSYRNTVSLNLCDTLKPVLRFSHTSAKMAVPVQRMIYGRAAGVAFSVDVRKGIPGVSINVNFGLGESVVQGLATPDRWILAEFADRPGEFQVRVAVRGSKRLQVVPRKEGDVVTVPVPPADRVRPVINAERAKELAVSVRKVRDEYAKEVDIEFVEDLNSSYIVQGRPETAYSARANSPEQNVTLAAGADKYRLWEKGFSGWPGVVRGKVVAAIVSANPAAEEIRRLEASVGRGDILVVNKTVPQMQDILDKVGGLIVEEGGDASHASIVAREKKKPAILGAEHAVRELSEKLGIKINSPDGFKAAVALDATTCTVYKKNLPADSVCAARYDEYLARQYSDETIGGKLKAIRQEMKSPDDVTPLGRPETGMTRLQADLYFKAFEKTAERPLNIDLELQSETPDVFLTPVEDFSGEMDPEMEVCFKTTWGRLNNKLFNALHSLGVEGIRTHLAERHEANTRWREALGNFSPATATGEDVARLFDAYTDMIRFFHNRWVLGRVIDTLGLEAMLQMDPESRAYCSDFRQQHAFGLPLLREEKTAAQQELQEALRGATKDNLSPVLRERLNAYGRRYPIESDVNFALAPSTWEEVFDDITSQGPVQDEPDPEFTLLQPRREDREIETDLERVETYIGVSHLMQIHNALTENEHFDQIASQYEMREKLLALGARLRNNGCDWASDEDIFRRSPEDLVQLAG